MNRKQRRAARAQGSSAGRSRAVPAGDAAAQLFVEALRCQQQNKLDDAARAYKRLLLLKPDHAEASNNLGCVLQAQGKLNEASARFARALALTPQLYDQFAGICATLVAVLPPLGEAMRRTMAAWPQRLPPDQMFERSGLVAIAADPLLIGLLQSTPVRDIAIERVLTSLRAALLADAAAGEPVSDTVLAFCCALAKQCFINEYVFATTPAEEAQIAQLKAALDARVVVAPMRLAALAMYAPLHELPGAQTLLDSTWPSAVDDVLTQQLREPMQERELREQIPRLTPIEDEVSRRVREQYEQNPYPRWVHVAGEIEPTPIDRHLRNLFPSSAFAPLGKNEALDVLVAGCGTGWQAIGITQQLMGARVLAVDLSLSSLAYAKRKTPASLSARIDYAQADILKLAAVGRSFDVVDSTGVLHHMADPLQGWRILLSLVRPGGLMHLGFYSELARREIMAARAFVAAHGYGATPAEIRRFRQDVMATPLAGVSRFNDFFSLSECRDLLFHVQETRMTIPMLKAFIVEHGLRFIGFEFDQAVLRQLRARFADAGWSLTDLDRWHAVETQYPDTFANMYHLWVQKG
jgi:2-polyprenyl-3-methyl-5-hydroxy-6-metoxy-1,4-benzoquinol methylase